MTSTNLEAVVHPEMPQRTWLMRGKTCVGFVTRIELLVSDKGPTTITKGIEYVATAVINGHRKTLNESADGRVVFRSQIEAMNVLKTYLRMMSATSESVAA